jgi:hypothetical protein
LELPEGAPVMIGTFTLHHHPAIILFDSGAIHSFISTRFGTKIGLDFYPTNGTYMITTPGGRIASNQICRGVPIQLGSTLIRIDLILLNLEGMDILLGMDWMTRHRVSLDIFSRVVEINSPEYGHTFLHLPQQEYISSCVYANEGIKLEDIPVVCEYPDVFSDELPGMPPDRDVEFVIELQPSTAPISKRPYRMPPNELAELKLQPQELRIRVISTQVLHLGDALLCLLRKRIIVLDYVLTIAPSMQLLLRISTLFHALISCLIS